MSKSIAAISHEAIETAMAHLRNGSQADALQTIIHADERIKRIRRNAYVGTTSNPSEAAMRTLHCKRCDAQPGESCRTRSGMVSAVSHADRFYDAHDLGLLPLEAS